MSIRTLKIQPGQYIDRHTFLIAIQKSCTCWAQWNWCYIKILSSYIGGRNGDKLKSSMKSNDESILYFIQQIFYWTVFLTQGNVYAFGKKYQDYET